MTAPKRETEKKARKVAKAKVKVAKAKVTAPNKTVKRVQVAPQPKVRKVEAPVTRAPTPTVATKVVPVRKTKAKPAKVAKAVSAKKTGGLGKAVPSNELAGSTRVVPLHVFRERANRGEMVVPKGYRKAWDDDRLNRRRAEGSLRGRDKMNLVWTNTVPRRLIDRTSGKDVTAKVALVYPYTSRAKQSRELGEVILMSRNGKTVKRIRRNTAAAAPAPAIKTAKPTAKAKSTRAVIATKSSKAAKPAAKILRAKTKAAKPVSRGQRYVQVGLFGVPSNASATASKLQTMGLPVRISKMTRSGKTLRSVMAGPFADASSVQSALQAVRRAGYADAYLR